MQIVLQPLCGCLPPLNKKKLFYELNIHLIPKKNQEKHIFHFLSHPRCRKIHAKCIILLATKKETFVNITALCETFATLLVDVCVLLAHIFNIINI